MNPGDKFELVFKNLLETLFVERMDQNEEIFVRFMNDAPFQKVVTGGWRRRRTGGCAPADREAARLVMLRCRRQGLTPRRRRL